MHRLQWKLNLKVRYNPVTLGQNLTGSNFPDLLKVFRQPYGLIWENMAESPLTTSLVEELETSLYFGRELILKTKDQPQPKSILYIDSIPSPP